MSNLGTIAELATAGGTLVLAIATFASIRAGRRSIRLSERSLRAAMRPLLFPTRFDDRMEKVTWQDQHHARVEGGHGVIDVTDEAVYLAMSVRNVGNGMAVMDRWCVREPSTAGSDAPAPLDDFRRLTRDLYVPPNDQSFWQGTFRDNTEPQFELVEKLVDTRDRVVVELLYGDIEGDQRTISRFTFMPIADDKWMIVLGRHWYLDNDDPR